MPPIIVYSQVSFKAALVVILNYFLNLTSSAHAVKWIP